MRPRSTLNWIVVAGWGVQVGATGLTYRPELPANADGTVHRGAGPVDGAVEVDQPGLAAGRVVADPPEHIVLTAVEQARSAKADLVIGFGGGSSMDVAKLVALLAHPACQQTLQDIYGVGNAKGQRLPLIQVPTTAGTGSEVMRRIAAPLVGGMVTAPLVSMLLIPVLYLWWKGRGMQRG